MPFRALWMHADHDDHFDGIGCDGDSDDDIDDDGGDCFAIT